MTSLQARAKGASVSTAFFLAVRNQVAALAESRVFEHIDNDYVLRGFEFAPADLGLYVGARPARGTSTERLCELVQAHPGDKSIIPIDIKNISPKIDHTGNVGWSMIFHGTQRSLCQAVVVAAAAFEPDFVALIPMEYLRPRIGSSGALYPETYRPLWTLHRPPAFPTEWAPFMVPLTQLGRALECMRLYAIGESHDW